MKLELYLAVWILTVLFLTSHTKCLHDDLEKARAEVAELDRKAALMTKNTCEALK